MRSDPVKDFYANYWLDPAQAHPVADMDAPHRLQIVRASLSAHGASRVLDAGCGRGDFAARLAGEGFEVLGMELSERAVSSARALHPQLTVTCQAVEDAPWPYPTASFDAVVALELIEHLLRPEPLFREARRVLRPQGVLLLSTPFHGRFKSVLLAASLRRFERHFCNLESGHIRFFTDRQLRALAEQHDFSTLATYHYGRRWPLWRGTLLCATKNGE